MIREVDLVSYLPQYMKSYQEMVSALEAENPEFHVVWEATDRILKNHFISTADEYGISQFEKMLQIQPLSDDSLENRRFRILSQWNNATPYTEKVLREKLDILCGNDGYVLEILGTQYMVIVKVALKNKRNFDTLSKMLDEMIPINMVISLSLLYNQHGIIANYTHRELAAYTQQQIRDEVLKHGN